MLSDKGSQARGITSQAAIGGPGLPSFRIGIPTYRRPDHLANLLAVLAPQLRRFPNVKLVVVNDAGHEPGYESLVADYDDIMDYRVANENKGPGPARAAAFLGATEDYLVGLDDDCLPVSPWIETLHACTQANPEVDLLAGSIVPMWTSPPTLLQQMLASSITYPAPVVNHFGLMTAVGANMAVKRAAYEHVGGYSDDMRGAAEDCCLTQHLLRSGATYQVCHSWVAGHQAANSIRSLRKRFYWYGFGGAQYVLREQDWRMASVHTSGTWRQSWKSILQKTREEWRESGERLAKRVAFTGVRTMIEAQYERGWRRGLKEMSGRYGRGLPERPTISEQHVDFSNSAQANLAFGQSERALDS